MQWRRSLPGIDTTVTMPRTLPIAAILFACCAGVPAWADGTAPAAPAPHAITLVQGGAFVNSSQSYGVPLTAGTGLFGWRTGYKLDAGVQPNLIGGYTAGLGATLGAEPGKTGSDYTLRIGGGWGGDRFSVNPFSHLGVSEVATPNSDMALSFTYSRAILPGLSVTGTAEAHRPVGASLADPTGGSGQIVIGGGLGIRF